MAACLNGTLEPVGRMRQLVEELVRLHEAELLAVALRLTRNREEASDLLQDALERALRFDGELAPQAPLGWMVTVMRNLFVDRCRQRRARHGYLRTLQAAAGAWPPEGGDTREAPPRSARFGSDNLRDAVGELEAPFREVFELRARSLTLSQIGALLGIPVATAGTRLFRARRKLRAILSRGKRVLQELTRETGPSPALADNLRVRLVPIVSKAEGH